MKLENLFRLDGKVALITGGGRGIGKFIATGFAEAGADLIISSRKMKNLKATAHELEEEFGITALPVVCDMAEEESIANMLKVATAGFPRIDILVNNAGITWRAPTLEFPLDRWDHVFNVNIRGTWILTQKIANIMKEQGGGNIINISSVLAFRGAREMTNPTIPYNSTKAAINALTMNLAVKLAPHNIRVNAIAPGYFHTSIMAEIEKPGSKKVYDTLRDSIPMHRFGDIDDMKGVAVFLASDASAFMTGHILVNDGGFLAK
jgi:gluconate 5-dehydrogenase